MATPKKSAARKKPAAATPAVSGQLKLSTLGKQKILEQLPPGFRAEGFEIIDNQLRVFGRVRDEVIGTIASEPGLPPPPAMTPMLAGGTKRESPLLAALRTLDHRLQELNLATDGLEDYLGAVLLSSAPTGESAQGSNQAGPADSHAVAEVFRLCSMVDRQIARITGMVARTQA
jgi:hypothetical protein